MRFRASAIAFVSAVSLLGCQPSDKTEQATSSAARAASPNVVTVIAREYAFQMPDTIPAGLTRFELKDEGKEPHHLMVWKLEEGKKPSDLLAAFKAMGPGGPGGPP